MPVKRESKQAARSAQTRAQILEAAEQEFALYGYAGARLDRIAERVGIHRVSISYYFEGKEDLYESVLAQLFEALAASVFKSIGEVQGDEAVEVGVSAAVSFVAERPRVAGLILRAMLDSNLDGPASTFKDQAGVVIERVSAILREKQEEGLCDPVDPLHLVSTVAGASLVFMTITPLLAPEWASDAITTEHLEQHKREVSRIVRRLLGLPDS